MQVAIDAPKRPALRKICNKCDTDKPSSEFHKNPKTKDGYCGACKGCRSKQAKEWYEANSERESAKSAQRRKENPEKRKETLKRSNAKRAGVVAEWQRSHKEEVNERNNKWRIKNLDKSQAKLRNYRTKKSGGGGSHTSEQFSDLCKRYKDRCICCGGKRKLEADHIVPVSKGGSSDIGNIQPLCRSCNASKNNQVFDYRGNPHASCV